MSCNSQYAALTLSHLAHVSFHGFPAFHDDLVCARQLTPKNIYLKAGRGTKCGDFRGPSQATATRAISSHHFSMQQGAGMAWQFQERGCTGSVFIVFRSFDLVPLISCQPALISRVHPPVHHWDQHESKEQAIPGQSAAIAKWDEQGSKNLPLWCIAAHMTMFARFVDLYEALFLNLGRGCFSFRCLNRNTCLKCLILYHKYHQLQLT